MIAKVWSHCENLGLRARTATLKVKYADFHQITRSHTVASGIASSSEFAALGAALLATAFPSAKAVRLLGITLSSLTDSESVAGQLRLKI